MNLIIIRHGSADYSFIKSQKNSAYWKNFAGLTLQGIEQVRTLSQRDCLKDADIIISSPYTRAYQTAVILSQELNIPLRVEIDLREWEHEKTLQFEKIEFNKLMKEFQINKGIHNASCKYKWENLESLGNRAFNVVKKYSKYNKVILVTHKMLIGQFTNSHGIDNCDIIELKFSNKLKPRGFISFD